MTQRFAAIDLGASSGRVVVASVAPDRLELTETHRFPNEPVRTPDGLQWDLPRLYAEILTGLRKAVASGPLASVGIDSWAVDFGLLDADGRLLGNPVHYRDHRTAAVIEAVHAQISPEEFYARTGLQFLPFNTVYQLASLAKSAQLQASRGLLLIPDLLGYWLTGQRGAERTNASTTQLLDVSTGRWALDLLSRLNLDPALLPALRDPGTVLGPIIGSAAESIGAAPGLNVVSVGSHDTASAVVAVPAATDDFGYISCGTWSLVGVELDRPVLTEASRLANFSNEVGVDGTIRYLRNVMGLWLLQESLRIWRERGVSVDLDTVLVDAAGIPAGRSLIDCGQPQFLPPGDMPARIAAACAESGQPVPATPAEFVRCILDSLALAYRAAMSQVSELSGRPVEVVHIVGGGSQNALLCQLTADACGVPVLAGPVEASALGNVLIQARTAGVLTGDLRTLRALVKSTQAICHYQPRLEQQPLWAAATVPS